MTNNLSESLDWFGTLRGRLGTTITPTAMIYGTGGLAVGRVNVADTVNSTNYVGSIFFPTTAAVADQLSTDTTKTGWTIGGGIEARLWGNWTGKIEYLYLDLGTVSGSFITPIVAPSGSFLAATFSSHVTDNILRLGINYEFH